jgi:hypothetical protein
MALRLVRVRDSREMPTHDWMGGICRKCEMPENSPARTSNTRHPELCFVVRRGACERCRTPDLPLCFDDDLKLSGRLCAPCLEADALRFKSLQAAAGFMKGSSAPCQNTGCGHPLLSHPEGLLCECCSCDRYRATREPGNLN